MNQRINQYIYTRKKKGTLTQTERHPSGFTAVQQQTLSGSGVAIISDGSLILCETSPHGSGPLP
jgi:hypothetical protein